MTIGDKHYLYRITGVWDPVKKNSRQVREYVGPCDENRNLIESRRREAVIASKTFRSYWLLQKISNSLGLKEKLRDCFDRDVREDILSFVMLRCVHPLSPRQVDDQMQGSFLSKYRSDDGMGSRDLSRLMMGISEESRKRFFESIYKGGGAIMGEL